jgi:hypothetical protein
MDDRSNAVKPGYLDCHECGEPAVRWDCWITGHNTGMIFGNCDICHTEDSTTELYTDNVKEAEIWLVNSTL